MIASPTRLAAPPRDGRLLPSSRVVRGGRGRARRAGQRTRPMGRQRAALHLVERRASIAQADTYSTDLGGHCAREQVREQLRELGAVQAAAVTDRPPWPHGLRRWPDRTEPVVDQRGCQVVATYGVNDGARPGAVGMTSEAYLTAGARARVEIDRQLVACGWVVQDCSEMNLYASQGVAVREFITGTGHGRTD